MKNVAVLIYIALASTIASALNPASRNYEPRPLQEKTGPGVTFRMPDKYMPMDFPKYKGMLLLDPDRPAGMFVVYVPDGETPAVTTSKVRDTVTAMFSSVSKALSPWTSAAAPAHESKPNETAELAVATGENADVQMLTVTLPNGPNTVVYGYFALRHTKKPQKDDGTFLKSDGTGVPEFDKFRTTIKPGAPASKESA